MTSDKTSLSFSAKLFKILYGTVKPIISVVLVLSIILCFFKPAKGSNSGLINLAVLSVSAIILILMYISNSQLNKKSDEYVLYQNSVVSKLNLQNNLPLWIMVLIIVIPFYILTVTSLKGTAEANNINFTWFPTKGVDLKSYNDLFVRASVVGIPMIKAMWNSFVYAIIPSVVGLFVSALSAYSFAKLEFKGSKLMYSLLIMTIMMPGCVTMTTAYIMYDKIGWVDSALPLIIPPCFGGAVTVMFLREYFTKIPNEFLESARIDGAGKLRCFFSVVLPIGKPALIAQFVMGFISSYNNFVGPLIYINQPAGYTIQIAINFLSGPFPDQSVTASAGVFALVPMLILYAIFQKQIVNGISLSAGLKG